MQQIEARRRELNRLSGDELDAKYQTIIQAQRDAIVLKAQIEEKGRAFNHQKAMADFAYWLKFDAWTLDESVALLLGRDPRFVNWATIGPCVNISAFAQQYADLRALAERATALSHGRYTTAPRLVIHWALEKGIPVPPELQATSKPPEVVQTAPPEKTRWVGHSTAVRALTDDGWLYQDASNQTFALDSQIFHGVSMPEIDAFIERLEAEGAPAGHELRERRIKAWEGRNNRAEFLRHMEWLVNRKREIEREEGLLQEIRRIQQVGQKGLGALIPEISNDNRPNGDARLQTSNAERRADRTPTVQEAIAPYVADVMQANPQFTAEDLYSHMRRDAGGDVSPFARLKPGDELFCIDAGAPCGLASVRAALTSYRKARRG